MLVKAPTENSILKGEINLPFLDVKRFDCIEDNLLMAIRQFRAYSNGGQQGRKLKIRTGWRRTESYYKGFPCRRFPEILIRGVWLEDYDFVEERYIHVIPFQNVLIVYQV